jgi:hypothetical protein
MDNDAIVGWVWFVILVGAGWFFWRQIHPGTPDHAEICGFYNRLQEYFPEATIQATGDGWLVRTWDGCEALVRYSGKIDPIHYNPDFMEACVQLAGEIWGDVITVKGPDSFVVSAMAHAHNLGIKTIPEGSGWTEAERRQDGQKYRNTFPPIGGKRRQAKERDVRNLQ